MEYVAGVKEDIQHLARARRVRVIDLLLAHSHALYWATLVVTLLLNAMNLVLWDAPVQFTDIQPEVRGGWYADYAFYVLASAHLLLSCLMCAEQFVIFPPAKNGLTSRLAFFIGFVVFSAVGFVTHGERTVRPSIRARARAPSNVSVPPPQGLR